MHLVHVLNNKCLSKNKQMGAGMKKMQADRWIPSYEASETEWKKHLTHINDMRVLAATT